MPLPRATLTTTIDEITKLQIKVYKGRLVVNVLTDASDTQRVWWLSRTTDQVAPLVTLLQGGINVARGKPPSHVPTRAERWQEATEKAREAVDLLTDAFADLESIQQEFAEWRDNMPENAQGGQTYQLLDAICTIELGTPDEAENVVVECEGVEVPQGWGRD